MKSLPVAKIGSPAGGERPALRAAGSILLISCYELGHQPLGVAWPLAFLEQAGYRPEGIDFAVEVLDPQKVARARFVGISVPMHTALRLGVRAAQRIREINPDCYICFYGLYASLNADYLLAQGADAVISGEYEASLVALVRAIEAGSPGAIEGVCRRGQPASPPLQRLAFPVASRRALPPLSRYARLARQGRLELAGYVEASRGCLHHCRHCPIPPVYQGRFFVAPVPVILEDIRRLVVGGAAHITFGDPDFLNGPGHSLRIARAMHAEFPHLTFDFTAKVSHIIKHRQRFPELAALGGVFVVSAVESLSDTVLAHLDKGHTRADVWTALRIVQDAGLVLRPSWVAFTPWTTGRDYLEMMDFIEAQGLIDQVDPVQYSIRLLIPPGSLLLSQPAIQPFLGALDAEGFSYRWTHPDPRMDALQQTVRVAVEQAARAQEDPWLTFYRVRALARAALGVEGGGDAAPARARTQPPSPRLTESWFC